jgi:hypothetical protein
VDREGDRPVPLGQLVQDADEALQPRGVVDVRRPVGGDEDPVAGLDGDAAQSAGDQRVDHRVADDEHPLRRHALGREEGGRTRRRREVQLRHRGRDPPVDLLHAPRVQAAQPGLEVCERDTGRAGRQCVHRHRARVAEGEHQFRAESRHHLRGLRVQRTGTGSRLGRQDAAVVHRQAERRLQLRAEGRIGVLPRVHHRHAVARGPERGHHRRQLDHLGAGAERHEHLPPTAHAVTSAGAHGSATGAPSAAVYVSAK